MKTEEIEYIECACGKCGLTRPKYNKWGQIHRFIRGHDKIGKKPSEETRKKISESQKGEKNHNYRMKSENHGNWKGDNISYKGLHHWVNKHLPKPDLCQLCKEKPPKELACITGIYNREFKNWARLCYKCHRNWDNVVVKSWITRKNKWRLKK
jgi:hypothetical protein